VRRIGVWKLVSAAKALTKQQVKRLLYAALFIWALLVIDYVGTGRRTALMASSGPSARSGYFEHSWLFSSHF
jgi:hypothetical protein